METLVCEQCGGELEIVADGIGRCIYNPKHIQKIPKKSTKLFQEAQKLWFEEKDFDKALEVYERILFENPKESSAHWGVLLCKYGIEYVKDYSGEYLPTCHRIVQESILEDGEYKLALDYAESRTEKLKYQEKAELIDRYQKKIQNIAANEEPVDVFISFKALDENGIPTADSALADRLYNYMTKELRLRVFFSTISLEGKTGEFEPYIYAALRSAKVLILIASSPEYVNAVWVKNEWSRFLRMIPEYQKKTVTIAMTGQMTKEALPKQLQVFTASTLNEPEKEAMFCHYVDEYIGELKCSLQKENKANDSEFEKLVLQQQVMKLEEAERFLVIGEFKWAENRFTEVCTRLKNNSSAYWGRLKATLHVKNDSELSQMTIEDLGKEIDYILAVKYGDDEQKRKYQEIREECAKRYDFQQKVQHLQKEYDDNYEIFHKNMMAPRPKCQFISTQTRNELEQYYQLTAQIEKAEKKRQCKKEVTVV